MPSVLWVSLPHTWKLSEVQAGLQVVIAVLCTWGIFAFSRFCWQMSSNRVRKNKAVALASLMSINTIGEAFDVISLLKRRIFLQRYWKLLAQSVVVVSLTVATIVSGPIAKASTRVGISTKNVTIPGLMATRGFNSRTYANVDWNETTWSLNRANFPLDQLLDFMPQPNSSWMYEAGEWNSTWSMSCNKTDNTPLTLYDSGVCSNMSVELPATNSFFPYDDFDWWHLDWHALFSNSTWLQDGMMFLAGWTYPGFDDTTNRTYSMTVSIAAMHMHNMLRANTSSTDTDDSTRDCSFGKGPVESASYTKIDCSLTRPRTIPDEYHVAFPDCRDWFALPEALVANYFDRMATESNTDQPISTIAPDELIRFYQTYIITKDIQYPHRVERAMTANLSVVQLSSTFIAFGSLYALLVILGLFNYGWFAYRNREVIRDTPESKLDWIVQSILDESETQHATARDRRSVVAPSIREVAARGSEKARHIFENARYGHASGEEASLTGNDATRAGSLAGSLYNQPTPYESPYSPPTGQGHAYDPSPNPGYGFPSPPVAGHGFANIQTAYNGSSGDYNTNYTMNPYEAMYAAAHAENTPNYGYELQNPQSLFTSDRRRGYQRIS